MFVVKVPRSKFYQLVYYKDGRRTTISTKATKQVDAFKFLEDFKKTISICKREDLSEKSTSIVSLTISQFEKEYFEYMSKSKSKHYLTSIQSSFKILKNSCGDIELNKLNFRMLDNLINSVFAKTQHGAHHYYRTLKAAFNKAIEWQYLANNPFGKMKPPKLMKSFPAFISENELVEIVKNTPQNYLKDLFIVAFYTGMRLNELINMSFEWINFENNLITIKCNQYYSTKSKKERIIPMCDKVKNILSHRKETEISTINRLVFFRIKGIKLHDETVSKQFKAVVRKLKMNERIHFHSLRHSFASLLAQKGISLYIIKELLGHEDLSTTQIYSHLQSSNLESAINSLSKEL